MKKVRLIYQKKNQSTETVCENNQMLDLTQKDFKIAVMNIFKELRKTFKTQYDGNDTLDIEHQ